MFPFLVLRAHRQLFTSLSLFPVSTHLIILIMPRNTPELHANQEKHLPFYLTTFQVTKSVTNYLSFVARTG